ncbi:hypothetical protein [Catellatospora vulcania]|uniref:hypothetical protein n=1 Tax=Catellatospora vulcania TaxID=1460450 RepID=UPI0012D3B951|nr:hypothetical protein [Catellatospora vulcania]
MDEWITTAGRLLAEPYPETMTQRADGFAEPGLHVAYLMVSRDFWDGDGREAMEPTLEEYEAVCDRLVAAPAERWGEPERIDLSEVLAGSLRGEEQPPLTGYLCGVAGGPAPLWRRDDRHVSVVVAWADKELPMIVTLAVGQN